MLSNLDVKSIVKLSLDDLKDQQVIARIEELSEDDQYVVEPMAAREFFEVIDDLLVNYGGQINGTEVYTQLFTVKIKLFWQSLPAMDKKLKKQALHENVTYALKNNVDIPSYTLSYLSIYELGNVPDNDERQMFLNSLTHNEETIGSQPIKLKTGESVRNTIINWLKDYLSYTDQNVFRGESYEMTQYLYSSPNAKALEPNDRQVLSKVIAIYNVLRHPGYTPSIKQEDASIPVPKPILDIPRPAPVVPAPPLQEIKTTPEPPSKEMTEFEKKLAQISGSAPSGHGVDLDVLKHRLEESGAKKPAAVQANLNNPLNAELKREVATREIAAPRPDINNPVNTEIKREVATTELPAYVAPKPVAPKPITPAKKPTPPPAPAPRPALRATSPDLSEGFRPAPRPAASVPHAGSDLKDIKNMDDLKKINLSHLRQGPIQAQIQEIKSKILILAQTNHVLPYYAVLAFEQSPLFQTYVASGNSKMESGELAGGMTHQEFEAVADLKKQVER